MLETTRIRREGYSYRPSFEDFMERFGLLAYGSKTAITGSATTCSKVLMVSSLQGWQMGKTKVFLKYWHVEQLDKQVRRYHDNAITIQKWVRGFLARRLRRRLIEQGKLQQKAIPPFFAALVKDMSKINSRLSAGNVEDMRRKAAGIAPKAVSPFACTEATRAVKRGSSVCVCVIEREREILTVREPEKDRDTETETRRQTESRTET